MTKGGGGAAVAALALLFAVVAARGSGSQKVLGSVTLEAAPPTGDIPLPFTLTATAKDTQGSPFQGAVVTFVQDGFKIATISSDGNGKAVFSGTLATEKTYNFTANAEAGGVSVTSNNDTIVTSQANVTLRLITSPYSGGRALGIDVDVQGNYYFGSATAGGPTPYLHVYNEITNTWNRYNIPAGFIQLQNVAVSHDNSKVYCSMTDTSFPHGKIKIFDIATKTFRDPSGSTISQPVFFSFVPAPPFGIWFFDRTYGIGYIDESTDIVNFIPYSAPAGLSQIVYDSYSNHIYALDYLLNKVLKIDYFTHRIVSTISVPAPSAAVGIAPGANGDLVVTDRDTPTVMIYNQNTSSWRLLTVPPALMNEVNFMGGANSDGTNVQWGISSTQVSPLIQGHFLDRIMRYDSVSETFSLVQMPQISGKYWQALYMTFNNGKWIYSVHDGESDSNTSMDSTPGTLGIVKEEEVL